MKIEANDKDIQEVFSIGYFRIPKFQRPYSWTLDEVAEFWNDVIQDRDGDYFIGSMVVYKQDRRFFGIVDGQQRLTTITLFMAALRNSFVKIGEIDAAKGVQSFIEKANVDNKHEFILNAETSYPYLQNCIQSYQKLDFNIQVGSEEQSLRDAFEYLVNKIDEYAYISKPQDDLFTNSVDLLKKIRDNILSLKLVFIQLDNEDDAYLIFETLNARGKDLTTPDLIKNMLLRKASIDNLSQFDAAKACWDQIYKRIDGLEGDEDFFSEFLLHFWISKYSYTTEKKLFSEVKYHLEKNSAADFLTELDQYSEFYVTSINPYVCQWEKEEKLIQDSLMALVKIFKVKQQNCMVLALLSAYRSKKITKAKMVYVLQIIEHFHLLFNAITQQRSSGSISTLYSNSAIKLTAAKNGVDCNIILGEFESSLKRKLPSYEEVQVAFRRVVYTSSKKRYKNIIRYILKRCMNDSVAGLAIDFDSLTIEHIENQCRNRSGDQDNIIGSVGNLLLTSQKLNRSQLADKSFLEKKKILQIENYPLDEVILASETWDANAIQERTNYIVHKIFYRK